MSSEDSTHLSIFKDFYKKILCFPLEEDQIWFLKVYPIFKFDKILIKLWIKFYDELHKTENRTYIIHFLDLMLTHSYVNYTPSDLFPVIEVLNKCQENTDVITRVKLEMIRIGSGDTIVRTVSNPLLNTSARKRRNSYEGSSKRKSGIFTVEGLRNNIAGSVPHLQLDKLSLDFFNVNPKHFAEELTRIYSHYINHVTEHELIYAAIHDNVEMVQKLCPNIQQLILYFQNLTHYIPKLILDSKNSKQNRILLVEKFIQIAKELKNLRNFYGMFTVYLGVTHMSLQRIKYLWEKKSNDLLEIEGIVTPINNYSGYRNLVSYVVKTNSSIIPFVGITTHDLKHALEINIYNCVNDNKEVNLNTYDKVIDIIKEFGSYNKYYAVAENIKLNNLIHEMKMDVCDEEILYKMSKEIYESPLSMSDSVGLGKTVQMPEENILRKHKRRSTSLSQSLIIATHTSDENTGITHRKSSGSLIGRIPVKVWTKAQVADWLRSNNVNENYIESFLNEEVTGNILFDITESHLKNDLKVNKLGHRLEIIRLIKELKHKL